MANVMDRELRRGTLELILLKLLSEEDMYGYQISSTLEERSCNEFRLKEGTLYPVFYRLEDAGFIKARWETAGRGKPRKYYSLTEPGAAQLELLMGEWKEFVKTVNKLLEWEK
jgi:PadR family transcriptional regulator PadR